MSFVLSSNSYGKSAVRLMKVERDGEHHEIREFTVDIALEGAFEDAHVDGDNSRVLPTDTMKNTVYAKAAASRLGEPEEFAQILAEHFVSTSPAASAVRIAVKEHGWNRLRVSGAAHGHAFERASSEVRVARISLERGGVPAVRAGIEELLVLKSAHSAFAGYPRDAFTTLRETEDRILATSISATWRYAAHVDAFRDEFIGVREAMLETFARHDSKSVQHTLYAMAEAVLERNASVTEVHMAMPNKHHLSVDMTAFGLANANEVFVPVAEPFGLIEATLTRR